MQVRPPGLARIRRALLLVAASDALDRGDIDYSERLWIAAATDFLIDATRLDALDPTRQEDATRLRSDPPLGRDDGG